METVHINKALAPKKWTEFKRWYKLACSSCSLSAEDAYKKLGYVRKTTPAKEEK